MEKSKQIPQSIIVGFSDCSDLSAAPPFGIGVAILVIQEISTNSDMLDSFKLLRNSHKVWFIIAMAFLFC